MAVDKKPKAVSAPAAVVAKKKPAPAAPPKPAPARKKAENDGLVPTRGVGKRLMIYAAAALLGEPPFLPFFFGGCFARARCAARAARLPTAAAGALALFLLTLGDSNLRGL